MIGPQDRPQYPRQVGSVTKELEPTPFLKYVSGHLYVWYEATDSGITVGEWIQAHSEKPIIHTL